jgi:two-component system, NtrC family, sensor kinase
MQPNKQMNKIFTFLLGLFAISMAFGQKAVPALEIKTDTVKYTAIPNTSWRYLALPTGLPDIDKVAGAENEHLFKHMPEEYPEWDSKHDVWIKYELSNASGHPFEAGLPALSGKTFFYISQPGGHFKILKTGYEISKAERQGAKSLMLCMLTLAPAQKVTVYTYVPEVIDAEDIEPGVYSIKYLFIKNYLNNKYYTLDNIMYYALIGFLLFAAVANIFFFYVNRERVYIMYAISLLLGISNAVIILFSDDLLSIGNGFFRTLSLLIFFGLLLMVLATIRQFLSIKAYFPKWDKFLAWFPVVCVAIVGYITIKTGRFRFAGTTSFGTILVLITFFYVVVLMVIIIRMYNKNKDARMFVLASFPFLLSIIVSTVIGEGNIIAVAVAWATLVVSWAMFMRFKNLQVEKNRLIAEQKAGLEIQVAERTAELERSLSDLKLTQNQLIQSEKMASLGELTAGIAHEIQNPLNFVNNFSDVSVELLQELKEEVDKGDLEEVNALADDVIQNLEKIAHHGRRADGIVKGMLQHSRASSGQKEPTDINALADEYLRLAYHGLRAKDKSFNADLITNFAEELPKINIIPQDIGRVLLNLFTNAFYATQEKGKQYSGGSDQSQLADYKPVVTVSTRQVGDAIEITVKDNGTGIPDAIKDKILQPFFTTKPTGEGTGLGLSLSYDIVVKGHGGTIDVKSVEGAEFILTLPLKTETQPDE